ncbi:uncharacterized protein LOC116147182 isoform X2 [Camelus dromedarius]|uniref:Uncharacterized protein LOC116657446 isoform X2 n=1 Tax=Camelus ferus TaxID=419612 RepID=A0A8B8RBP6_CAMFR|nr:uncharacterized protein LOC116147182 isoform X2 [Camelus dromedarius]XP_032315403.1 uncharacterized protein LOC116657446 isoform X2 [Camelus ferus]
MVRALDYYSQEASRRRAPSRRTRRARRPALSGKDCQWRRGWWEREHGCTWGLRGRSSGGGEPGRRDEKPGQAELLPAPCRAPPGLSLRPRLALTSAPEIPWKLRGRDTAKAGEAPAGLLPSMLCQGTSSALHHPPGHKELLLVLKVCLKRGQKKLLPQLWTGI